jgi:hypothetical protein
MAHEARVELRGAHHATERRVARGLRRLRTVGRDIVHGNGETEAIEVAEISAAAKDAAGSELTRVRESAKVRPLSAREGPMAKASRC